MLTTSYASSQVQSKETLIERRVMTEVLRNNDHQYSTAQHSTLFGLGRRTKLLHWPTIPPYENEGVIECFPSVISDDIQHVGFGI